MELQPGFYTYQEVMDAADFDVDEQAAADYNSGRPDFRRVQIGGLSFDDPSDRFVIPEGAESVEVRLDGEVVATIEVAS